MSGAPRPAYVGARLAEAPFVQEVLAVLAQGTPPALPTYDWTIAGSVRGNPAALREVAAAEVAGAARAGADPQGLGVFLLATGRGSPQRGVHVELGAFLAAGLPLGVAAPRALLWVPPEHADTLAVVVPDALAFYHHPRVVHAVCPRDFLLARVAAWLLATSLGA